MNKVKYKDDSLTCLRCEKDWIPRTDNPVSCPRCKSSSWNKPYVRKPIRKDG